MYTYSVEHYKYWHGVFPNLTMPNGMFGENLTVQGLFGSEVNVGNTFRMGSAMVIATQPRMSCYKLGVKFGRMDVIKKFLASGRPGIYFKVSKEGEVSLGDSIMQVTKDPYGITISDIVRLYSIGKEDLQTMQRAVKVKALPNGRRNYFLDQIQRLEK